MSGDMPSAVFRVVALPELREHILLSRPRRHDGLPDFGYFVLQRVSRGFKDTIHNSKHIRRRMLLEDVTEDPIGRNYKMIEWLSERAVLPAIVTAKYNLEVGPQGSVGAIPTNKPTERFNGFVFIPETLYLTDPVRSETVTASDSGLGYTLIEAHGKRALLEKPSFSHRTSSWRRLPVYTGRDVDITWLITLIDSRRRLSGRSDKFTLVLRFEFGGKYPPGMLGELFDLIEGVKARCARAHIRCQVLAMKKAFECHVLNEDWSQCQRCVNAKTNRYHALLVQWPEDRELFPHLVVSGIDESVD